MKLSLKFIAAGLAVAGSLAFGLLANAASQPRDCDNNSIIHCGAYSYSELKSIYNANKDEVGHTGIQDVYKHYGVSISELANAKDGVVKKNGDVVVGGKVVATGAYGVGRENSPGSTKITINGKTYYQRSDTRNFLSDIQAFVVLDQFGHFKYAVLKSCGNPEMAKPKPVQIKVCNLSTFTVVTIDSTKYDSKKYSTNLDNCKPSVACTGLTVTQISRDEYRFTPKTTASHGGKITSYSYNFGDGTVRTSGEYSTHLYKKPGTYTTTVTITTNVPNKTKITCSAKVTVQAAPAAACTSLKASEVSLTERKFTTVATATNGAKITGYSYNFGDGTTTSGNATINHTYKPGTYTAKVTVKTSLGDKKDDTKCAVKVTVKEAPVAACNSLTATEVSRTERKFTTSATASNGATITGYTYDFGDGTTAPGSATINHNYSKPGTYTARVTVKTSLGDKTSDKCAVKVTIKEAPAAACTGLSYAAIDRDTFSFTTSATATGGATITGYSYNFGDGQTANGGATIQHTYAQPGTYTVKATVHTSLGDKSDNCTTKVIVEKAPAAICKGLSATISNRTDVTLKGSASAENGATITSYVFTVTNADGQTVFTKEVPTSATSASVANTFEAGTYTAKLVVKTSLGEKDGANCPTVFTVVPPKTPGVKIEKYVVDQNGQNVKDREVTVGGTYSYKIIVTNTGEVDLVNAVVSDAAEQHPNITLLTADKGTIANNTWTYTIPKLAVGQSMTFTLTAKVNEQSSNTLPNTACVDANEVPGSPDDCDKATVHVPEVCTAENGQTYPVGAEECQPTPETPELPELPTTGTTENLVSILGLGSIVTAAGAYIASRKQ